jgi:hypothetical protein
MHCDALPPLADADKVASPEDEHNGTRRRICNVVHQGKLIVAPEQ